MSEREKTPDLLSQIVGQTESKTDTVLPPAVEPPAGPAKETLRFPAEVMAQLDEVWREMSRMTGTKRVNKSEIVTVALQFALDDFAANREKSQLVRRLRR